VLNAVGGIGPDELVELDSDAELDVLSVLAEVEVSSTGSVEAVEVVEVDDDLGIKLLIILKLIFQV